MTARKAEKKAPAGGKGKAPAAKKEKRIAIVGCSDSKEFAPYDDKTWEMWSINNAYTHVVRSERWFELHPFKFEDGKYYRRKLIYTGVFEWSEDFRGAKVVDYMSELRRLNIPVYMQQHWENIPKSLPYPLDSILKQFGNYFTNTVSYMIAMAITEGATEIGCYGVDMATASEYGPQRPSCEFFLGIAAGMGITITMPKQADLLKTKFLYAFGEREQTEWEAKLVQIQKSLAIRRQKSENQMRLSEKQVNQYIGAQESMREVERIWSNHATPKTWKDQQ